MNTAASLELVRSMVRAAGGSTARADKSTRAVKPVVTISRQSGIDPAPLAELLATRLQERTTDDPQWLVYGRALVERVAADHDLSEDLVASLDERDKSWFEHFTAGLTGAGTGADVAMKTARSIRALARMGHAVIVGRGGQFVLQAVPHVVHIRLIAPLEWRLEAASRAENLDAGAAEATLRDLERSRSQYIRNHFGRDVEDETAYHLVLNLARISQDRVASIVLDLVRDASSG